MARRPPAPAAPAPGPARTQPGFPEVLAKLDQAIHLAQWSSISLGGPRFAPPEPRDTVVRCQPFPRLVIITSGHMRHASSVRGERKVVAGGPGQVYHWATNAWNLEFWDAPTTFLGCVFRPDFVRVLHYDHAGGALTAGPARIFHHTARPLGPAGRLLLGSLDALADDGPDPGLAASVGHLMQALLDLTRAHVQADLSGGAEQGALRTWQEAMQYLAEHLNEELSRDGVAAVLGLHPNYLSTLFTRHAGASFHRTIEGLRIDRAKAVLRSDGGMRIRELAGLCGYADPGHFIRVFKRVTGRTPGRFARR
jgi:AraC-like DNA-binding protein